MGGGHCYCPVGQQQLQVILRQHVQATMQVCVVCGAFCVVCVCVVHCVLCGGVGIYTCICTCANVRVPSTTTTTTGAPPPRQPQRQPSARSGGNRAPAFVSAAAISYAAQQARAAQTSTGQSSSTASSKSLPARKGNRERQQGRTGVSTQKRKGEDDVSKKNKQETMQVKVQLTEHQGVVTCVLLVQNKQQQQGKTHAAAKTPIATARPARTASGLRRFGEYGDDQEPAPLETITNPFKVCGGGGGGNGAFHLHVRFIYIHSFTFMLHLHEENAKKCVFCCFVSLFSFPRTTAIHHRDSSIAPQRFFKNAFKDDYVAPPVSSPPPGGGYVPPASGAPRPPRETRGEAGGTAEKEPPKGAPGE